MASRSAARKLPQAQTQAASLLPRPGAGTSPDLLPLSGAGGAGRAAHLVGPRGPGSRVRAASSVRRRGHFVRAPAAAAGPRVAAQAQSRRLERPPRPPARRVWGRARCSDAQPAPHPGHVPAPGPCGRQRGLGAPPGAGARWWSQSGSRATAQPGAPGLALSARPPVPAGPGRSQAPNKGGGTGYGYSQEYVYSLKIVA